MATVVTHQPRPVPAFGRHQHSACIAYRSSPLIPNQSQSSVSFLSSMDPRMDLYPRSTIRQNRLPQIPLSLHHRHHHHSPHTPPYYNSHHRTTMTSTAYPRHTPPLSSSAYPLVYSPTENSYHSTPMSADIQNEYPFDITYSNSAVNFAELDLSQTAFLNPGQLPWSEAKSDFKVESSPVPQPVFYADPGNYTFYNDSTNGTALDAQLFSAAQSQSHPTPEMQYPSSPPAPHVPQVFVQPSEVMPPSPPTFAPVPFPRVPGSSSPPGLTESDEEMISESGDSEAADPSDAAEGDDDGDFMPSRMSLPRTRSRRTSSVSVSSGSGSVRAARSGRLGAPVPVPNLTKKSRGRRVPTAPVFMVQGGVQKNMRMYRCTVDGCYKCFARGEHLKRHVRSIHTNEKRECPPFCYHSSSHGFYSSQMSCGRMWKGL